MEKHSLAIVYIVHDELFIVSSFAQDIQSQKVSQNQMFLECSLLLVLLSFELRGFKVQGAGRLSRTRDLLMQIHWKAKGKVLLSKMIGEL